MRFMTQEWLKAAHYDLLALESMKENALLTTMIAFHAQQCIEKSFKAVLAEKDDRIPKVHGLVALYAKVSDTFENKYDLDIFKTFDELYIEARYPGEMGLLPNGEPSQEEAKAFVKVANEIFSQVQTMVTEDV